LQNKNHKMHKTMKKKFTLILFILVTTFCFGQKIKRKIEYFPKSKKVAKLYTVLKKNKNIKHGEFTSYFKSSNTIKEQGNYLNNKKDGYWIEWTNPSKMQKGNYLNGKKIGIWEMHYKKQKLFSFDYDLNKKIGIERKFQENGKVIERFDHDKNESLPALIKFNITYPVDAIENKIEGVVKYSYKINTNCEIEEFKIVESLSETCDKSVIDAFEKYAIYFEKYNSNCTEESIIKKINFNLN